MTRRSKQQPTCTELLELLDEPTRREVRALLAYAEDEAGGRMSPRFARARPDMTVEEAILYLRRQAKNQLETIYYAYVLDSAQRLLGVVSFRELFSASSEQLVSEVMETEIISVPPDQDQESVARLLDQYDLLAIPVVTEDHRMQGIVTVDDVVDVIHEETTEDFHKIGGMQALESPYLQASYFTMIKKRVGWLALLFVGEMLTASAMGLFQAEIAKVVVLALFIPLIISSGGNSGSQASTLVIRAMTLGQVSVHDWWTVIRREMLAGLTLGAVLALIGLSRIFAWHAMFGAYGEQYALVGVTLGLSLIGVVIIGTLTGSMLPIILHRLKLDPASASAPLVATVVDVTGLVIYFTIAKVLLL